MTKPVLIIGAGHLAHRVRKLASASGAVLCRRYEELAASTDTESDFEALTRSLDDLGLASLGGVFLVDDRDERNLELLIALISLDHRLPVVASLFNENIAPHLQAANPNIRVLNPARIAAPAFIDALSAPVTHTLRYAPAPMAPEPSIARADSLIRRLVIAFAALTVAAIVFFHFAEGLSWLDAVYFVVVTMATVGYGDITLLHSGVITKLFGIALILASTGFIWMIFSLTVDGIIKRRVQLSLGRKRYARRDHVILCGLGRLGYFVAEGLLDRGENVLIVERDETSTSIEHFRRRGADVYIGDARLPRVLEDVGVHKAKALYSLIDDDFTNLEIGLNARSFVPQLRLVLRIFDEAMSRRVRESLDIHLTFSMSAIADGRFVAALLAAPAPAAAS